MENAVRICTKYFQCEKVSTIPGGVHATPKEVVREIIHALKPEEILGKAILEIGLGYPRLACILSILSGKSVLCNDLRKLICSRLRSFLETFVANVIQFMSKSIIQVIQGHSEPAKIKNTSTRGRKYH